MIFLKKPNYNNKITEKENKIPIISGLAATSALTAVESKIPIISSLVKKKQTDYNTKTTKIEKKVVDYNQDKYVTTPEFNKLIAEILLPN